MILAEYDQRLALLNKAWRQVHHATDTPESSAAVRALNVALRTLAAYARRVVGQPPPSGAAEYGAALAAVLDPLVEHGHLQEKERALLQELAARAESVNRWDAYSDAVDRAYTVLVSKSLPVVWNVITTLQDELRAERSRAFYLRRLRWTAGLLAIAAALWGLYTIRTPLYWRFCREGWRVTYFDGTELRWPRAVRGAAQLSMDYGDRRPAALVRRNRWSARWEGIVQIPVTTSYTFVVQSDEGCRLFVDNTLVVDRWKPRDGRAVGKADVRLEAGPHALRVEHCDRGGIAAVRLLWDGGPIPSQSVVGVPYVRKY